MTLHKAACVDNKVTIGPGAKALHVSHILGDVSIGRKCNTWQNVVIGSRVKAGNEVKLQNNVSVYEGVILEDGVFCGRC